jgi:hypothetical protein
MNRDDILRMAREQGLPETEVEGVFIVNSDDLGRLLAAERAEREWVSLTDEETDYWIGSNSTKKALCRAIGAALKEKNNG